MLCVGVHEGAYGMRERQAPNPGRPRLGPIPKSSEIRWFYGFSRFWCTRTLGACRHRGGRGAPMGGGGGGANKFAVGVELLGVSGPRKPKFSSVWVEKRLITAQERL
jgi:hypothetical protein